MFIQEVGGDGFNESEVACGGLVIAGCQPPGIFQTVDAALDAVAQGIEEVVDWGAGLCSFGGVG